jgi:hypothetical protein
MAMRSRPESGGLPHLHAPFDASHLHEPSNHTPLTAYLLLSSTLAVGPVVMRLSNSRLTLAGAAKAKLQRLHSACVFACIQMWSLHEQCHQLRG